MKESRKDQISTKHSYVGSHVKNLKSFKQRSSRTVCFWCSALQNVEYEMPVSQLPGAPVQVQISKVWLHLLDQKFFACIVGSLMLKKKKKPSINSDVDWKLETLSLVRVP